MARPLPFGQSPQDKVGTTLSREIEQIRTNERNAEFGLNINESWIQSAHRESNSKQFNDSMAHIPVAHMVLPSRDEDNDAGIEVFAVKTGYQCVGK